MMLNTTSAPSVAIAGRSKYPDLLRKAWQDHIVSRSENAPTVISTFAGAGGSSLGYSMAGYHELLAVEWDRHAVECFELNFPSVPVYHGDIMQLTVDECLRKAGIKPGELDVLDGSPPCQGFSLSGKRQLDDPRNYLFREYVRLLQGLRPKVFVMENVAGMVKGKMKLLFVDILRSLKASGYLVSARLLNAMYFNVPQSRERMIFIGVRADLLIKPAHPHAQSPIISFREACEGIETVGMPLKGRLAELGQYAIAGENFSKTRKRLGANNKRNFSTKKLHWDRVACTVSKTMGDSLGGLVHPDHNAMISIDALKRIGSFPDEFCMTGTDREKWARIGNSVPPLFMRVIAEHVRRELLEKLHTYGA